MSAVIGVVVHFWFASALAQPASPAPPPSPAPSVAPGVEPPAAPSSTRPADPPKGEAGKAPASSAPVVEETARAEAKKKADGLFKNAQKLFARGEYAAALVEYQAAYRISPTKSARASVGACLLKLQRFDEALEVFEATLREYGAALPPKMKEEVRRQIDTLRTVTGAVMITGAEVGALIVIDGRLRGEHPAPAPLSVLAGPHFVRVYKEGFAVYEKSVEVAKGQIDTIPATLVQLTASQSGRLKVAEIGGRQMEVVVDGVPVGVTPWEGPVSAGEHAVLLRQVPPAMPPSMQEDGCACDAPLSRTERTNLMGTEDTIATVPVAVLVKPHETAALQLKAEPLGALMKIAPVPASATVFLDGIALGRGGFEGRIKPGEHEIRTEAPGYFPETQKVTVPAGEANAVPVTLRKDHNAPVWEAPGHYLVEVGGGGVLVPSFGGDVAASCKDACQQGVGAGGRVALRAGYEFGNGFGIGATLGYLGIQRSTTGRTASLLPASPDGRSSPGVLNDTIAMQGFLMGPYAALRLGQRFPVHLGLAAGVSLSSFSVRRTGLFEAYAVGPVTQSGFFPWLFLEPEVRVGVRVIEHLTVGVSVSGLLLFATGVPQWKQDMLINPHGGELQLDLQEQNRIGRFAPETITGSAIVGITEGLSAHYDF